MAKYTVRKGKKNYTGTNGDDTFATATGGKKPGSFSINAKGGNDKIYIAAGSGNIDVGTGSDFVKVTGGKVNRIRLSQGRNEIIVSGGRIENIVGDGKSRTTSDIITVSNQKKKVLIKTSHGADKVTVNGIHNDTFYKVSRAKIETSDGKDTIVINKGGFNRINSGNGNDSITINGGSNYVQAGGKKDIIEVNSKYGNYVKGQAGSDVITLGKNARRCIVDGGDGFDTITVKSTASGKVGNLIKNVGGDTIDVHYKYGMTLVVDNRNDMLGDTIRFISSSNEPASWQYFKKNDVMEISDNFHILGFSKLSEFNFVLDTVTTKFRPTALIKRLDENGAILISDSKFDIPKLLKPYNKIETCALNATSANYMGTSYGIAMGYKG